MEIERAIYAAVQKGIEGKNGITYFSYTNDYKKVVEKSADNNFEGKLTSFYLSPNIDEAYPYHDDASRMYALPQDVDELNALEDGIIKEVVPKTFAFRKINIEGQDRAVFMYGKFMGADWTGGRYSNMYHYTLLCDLSDIASHPIFYCSSPVVCCDIKRSYFYPNGELAPEPTMLPYVDGLEAKFDRDIIPHTAGFGEITKDSLKEFINEPDSERINLLKSMIDSLINFKSGNPNSRIIIADMKENMLLWIAAITYVFPKEIALDISFSSYENTVGEFDINGVFVPELNGCEPNDSATNYNYNVISNLYSIYDYKRNVFGSNVEVDENVLFYKMIAMAYSIDLNYLDSYKEYIIKNTSYRIINRDYIDGYSLFSMTRMNKIVSVEEFRNALKFANKYLDKNEAEYTIKYMFSNYDRYDEKVISKIEDCLSSYVDYCLKSGYITVDYIDSALMQEVYDCFRTDYKLYKEKVQCVERLCKFKSNEIERMFFKHFGMGGLLDLIDTVENKNALAYIVTTICVSATAGMCELGKKSTYGNLIEKIIRRLFESDSEHTSELVIKMIQGEIKYMSSSLIKLRYMESFYNVAEEKDFKNMKKTVVNEMVGLYISGGMTDKNVFVTESIASEKDWELFNHLIEKYSLMDMGRMQEGYSFILQNYSKQFYGYNDKIIEGILKRISLDQKNNNVTYNDIQKCYEMILSICSISSANEVSISSDVTNVLDIYVDKIYEAHPDFIINKEEKKYIVPFLKNDDFVQVNVEHRAIVSAFLTIAFFENKLGNKIGTAEKTWTRVYLTSYSDLPLSIRDDFLNTATKLCCKYWEQMDNVPPIGNFVLDDDPNSEQFLKQLVHNMLLYFCKKQGRTGIRHVASAIELAISMKYVEMINDIPRLMIREHIAIPKLNKVLESDIEAKEKDRKVNELVASIKIQELNAMVTRLKDEHERCAKAEKKNLFSNLFKKNK